MSLLSSLLAALATGACVSRLLTTLALWQMKEWRWDRLKEHLRAHGWAGQLYGSIESALVLIAIIVTLSVSDANVLLGALIVLNVYGLLRSVLNKQPTPRWTQKAFLIALASLILLLAIATLISAFFPAFLVTLPLLTPAVVIAVWIGLRPLDRLLKTRILRAAMMLREKRANLLVIGITGSVGKTTTKELLTHVLAERTPLTTPAHVNTEMGVAQWMLRELPSHPDATVLIVEMGAYRRGEISLLCEIAKPSVGIITSIGSAHLALFGSREAIAEAKGELFASLPAEGHAFFNADAPMGEVLRARCVCPVTTVGTGGASDLIAHDIEETPNGIRFSLDGTVIDVALHGTHSVTNILLAIAVAEHLGLARPQIVARLATFMPQEHTFEVKTVNGITMLDDTYNASPESFKAACAWARMQPHPRKILVTGGIIELGDDEAKIHVELAATAGGIFQNVYLLNDDFFGEFSQGMQHAPILLGNRKPDVKAGDLVVCIGRMSPALVTSFAA